MLEILSEKKEEEDFVVLEKHDVDFITEYTIPTLKKQQDDFPKPAPLATEYDVNRLEWLVAHWHRDQKEIKKLRNLLWQVRGGLENSDLEGMVEHLDKHAGFDHSNPVDSLEE